ncbi:extradiol dioxygenase family protein [Kribbella amoyensis]|uniref:Extradiol dioxygenase family protein n=1 Tax=Kribbella amoyensis TaxID=996641 RepID=A0A561C1B5_9ACTN|nr:VOC family protein [Kribbella amoyensis]TWD84722.1 extradiol dioxygenase family protein [Kribbella amoyensis]
MAATAAGTAAGTGIGTFDMAVEVIVIPVSDVERAKEFYARLGWRVDVTPPGVVQLTPPGSGCSVHFGPGLTEAAPGSAKGYLVVPDVVTAREALVAVGVDVGEIFHPSPDGPVAGADPERRSYFSRAVLADPDGNTWILQEVTTRLPGRVDPGATAYDSVTDLESSLRRAEAAHGEHEQRTGVADANWPAWYAAYMAAERAGTELPT